LKIGKGKTLALVSAFAILVSGVAVFALTTLFTQTIPGQSFSTTTSTSSTSTSTSPYLTVGSCGDALELHTLWSTIPTYEGQAATLVFDCGVVVTTVQPAFTTGGTVGEVTPNFILPSGWTLSVDTLVDVDSYNACQGEQVVPLTSGQAVTLLSDESYFYCLTSNGATTFSSFGVSWSQ